MKAARLSADSRITLFMIHAPSFFPFFTGLMGHSVLIAAGEISDG